jgi:hypothetical protein
MHSHHRRPRRTTAAVARRGRSQAPGRRARPHGDDLLRGRAAVAVRAPRPRRRADHPGARRGAVVRAGRSPAGRGPGRGGHRDPRRAWRTQSAPARWLRGRSTHGPRPSHGDALQRATPDERHRSRPRGVAHLRQPDGARGTASRRDGARRRRSRSPSRSDSPPDHFGPAYGTKMTATSRVPSAAASAPARPNVDPPPTGATVESTRPLYVESHCSSALAVAEAFARASSWMRPSRSRFFSSSPWRE